MHQASNGGPRCDGVRLAMSKPCWHAYPVSTRTRIVVGAATLTTVVCGLMSAPGMTWLDAGDLVTASAVLGVPHATGFPVYTMLGHLALFLPIGTLAGRMALMSAVFAGVTVGFLLATVARRTKRQTELVAAAVGLVLLHLSSATLSLNSCMAEVYTLNTALAAAGLYFLQRYSEHGDARDGFALAVVVGLGLAHYALFRLVAVALLVPLLWMKTVRQRRYAIAFVCLVTAALLAYVYLPIAASRAPAHNWGDPSTLGRFWAHVTASEIRSSFSEQILPGGGALLVHLRTFGRQLYHSLGPLLIFACGGLLVPVIRRIRLGRILPHDPVAIATVLIIGADVFYAVAIHPMGLASAQNGQLSELLLSVVGCRFAVGVFGGLGRFVSPRMGTAVTVLGVGVPFCLLLYWDDTTGVLADDWSIEDITVVHLSHAPPGALTVLISDSMNAAHLYARYAVDARPDTGLLDRNLLGDSDRLSYALTQQPVDLVPPEVASRWRRERGAVSGDRFMARARQLLDENTKNRAVFWEVNVTREDLPPPYRLRHHWPIGRVVVGDAAGERRCAPREWGFCEIEAEMPFATTTTRFGAGPFYRDWLANQWGYVGKRFFKEGAFRPALSAFENAAALDPAGVGWKNNTATCLAALGQYSRALEIIDGVLEGDPLSGTAIKNGMLYSRQHGDKTRFNAYRALAERLGIMSGVPNQQTPDHKEE